MTLTHTSTQRFCVAPGLTRTPLTSKLWQNDLVMKTSAGMHALGRIGTAKAQESLRQATAEKDVVVRNAVSRAMRAGGK